VIGDWPGCVPDVVALVGWLAPLVLLGLGGTLLTISCPTFAAASAAFKNNGRPSSQLPLPQPQNKRPCEITYATATIPAPGKILQYLAPVAILVAILYRSSLIKDFANSFSRTTSAAAAGQTNMTVTDSLNPVTWRKQLDALPTGGRIPAFFFAHGCISCAIVGD